MNANNITKIAEHIKEKMAQFNTMMLKLQEMSNKPVEQYKCVFSESYDNQGAITKHNLSNKRHIKNLSNNTMTTEQINLLGKGL